MVLENTGYDRAMRQPFLKSLARRGALLRHFPAEAHPSLPNYIALVSGRPSGSTMTHDVTLDKPQIGDLLEAKGLSWKVYAEGYPGGCFLKASDGDYVRKHVPFLSFKNVQTDPARCARIVNAAELKSDVRDERDCPPGRSISRTSGTMGTTPALPTRIDGSRAYSARFCNTCTSCVACSSS